MIGCWRGPRYGEWWGRHWLDVARYADTKDLVLLYGRDALRPFAYTYRDYVIRAFNEDLPFDAFVRDQIAADLESPPCRHGAWRRSVSHPGRLFDNNPHDQIDDQIDTVTRGLLGLTVARARCHDHCCMMRSDGGLLRTLRVFASTERPYVLPLIEDPAMVPGGPAFEERLAAARKELEDHIDAGTCEADADPSGSSGRLSGTGGDHGPGFVGDRPVRTVPTPEDFRPSLMQRTRMLIARRAVPADRVFGPWSQLMGRSEAEFSKGAVTLGASDADWNPADRGGAAPSQP